MEQVRRIGICWERPISRPAKERPCSPRISRRDMMKTATLAAAASTLRGSLLNNSIEAQASRDVPTQQWGIFEATHNGPSSGNPYVDVEFSATFSQADTSLAVDGFYDGDGIYRVRFMPPLTGAWTYRTRSNRPELDNKAGAFTVRAATPGNRGPVRVKDQYHFTYADGTPYRELGTTCYAWTSQPAALEEQTLKTLASAPFNKMRMCVFPKWYVYNHVEPPLYPFAGDSPNHRDFTRINPAYFQHFERRVAQLARHGHRGRPHPLPSL